MRVYLDTNILVFLWNKDIDNIDRDVSRLINDYESQLLTSSVCVVELIHLLQIGKLRRTSHKKTEAVVPDVSDWLERTGIAVVQTSPAHLRQMNNLPIYKAEHNDPFDRFIISQAIADRIPLVSSDRKFKLYEHEGLQLIFNHR